MVFLVVKERQRIKAISEVYREVLLEFVEKAGAPMKSSHRALMDRLGEFPALIFACKEGAPEQGLLLKPPILVLYCRRLGP